MSSKRRKVLARVQLGVLLCVIFTAEHDSKQNQVEQKSCTFVFTLYIIILVGVYSCKWAVKEGTY